MGKKVKEQEVVEKKSPFDGLPRLICKNKNQEKLAKAIVKNDVVVGYGPAGTGKAQPLYSLIYTPNGPVEMGSIKVGDKICGANGDVVSVSNIYYQGFKDCYRVFFSDGVSVDCCGEHLWKVSTEKDRNNNKYDKYEIKKTIDLIENIKIREGRRNYKIPICQPVFYNKKELQLDPYILGILIGDGGMTGSNTILSTKDEFIVNYFKKYLEQFNLSLKQENDCDWRITGGYENKINKINQITKSLGLRCKSEFKFIPKEYLHSSIDDRISLLQGLMDSDGTTDKRGSHIYLSTSSEQLKNDFCELVRSIGGITRVYTKKTKTLDNYIITVNIPKNIIPFRLDRKLNLMKEKTKYITPRYIDKIEYIGKIEQQCIEVDSSDHLYITDNHVVTHNTYVALSQAFELAKKYPDKYKSIVLIKSVTVVKSEEIGFIPGSAQEKMDPFMYSFTCLIDKLFENKGTAKRLLSAGVIEWLPLAFVRGINIDNSIVILDETQNISTDLFKTIITRLGKDSKIIFLGDAEQIDMKEKHKSCLSKICDMFKESEFVKIVKFDETDCVRNKIIPQILKIFKQHEM